MPTALVRDRHATGTVAAMATFRGADPVFIIPTAHQLAKDISHIKKSLPEVHFQNSVQVEGRIVLAIAWTLAKLDPGITVTVEALFLESLLTTHALSRIIGRAYEDGLDVGTCLTEDDLYAALEIFAAARVAPIHADYLLQANDLAAPHGWTVAVAWRGAAAPAPFYAKLQLEHLSDASGSLVPAARLERWLRARHLSTGFVATDSHLDRIMKRLGSSATRAGFCASGGALDFCEGVGQLLGQMALPSELLLPEPQQMANINRYLLDELTKRIVLRHPSSGQPGAARIALATRIEPLLLSMPSLTLVLGKDHVTNSDQTLKQCDRLFLELKVVRDRTEITCAADLRLLDSSLTATASLASGDAPDDRISSLLAERARKLELRDATPRSSLQAAAADDAGGRSSLNRNESARLVTYFDTPGFRVWRQELVDLLPATADGGILPAEDIADHEAIIMKLLAAPAAAIRRWARGLLTNLSEDPIFNHKDLKTARDDLPRHLANYVLRNEDGTYPDITGVPFVFSEAQIKLLKRGRYAEFSIETLYHQILCAIKPFAYKALPTSQHYTSVLRSLALDRYGTRLFEFLGHGGRSLSNSYGTLIVTWNEFALEGESLPAKVKSDHMGHATAFCNNTLQAAQDQWCMVFSDADPLRDLPLNLIPAHCTTFDILEQKRSQHRTLNGLTSTYPAVAQQLGAATDGEVPMPGAAASGATKSSEGDAATKKQQAQLAKKAKEAEKKTKQREATADDHASRKRALSKASPFEMHYKGKRAAVEASAFREMAKLKSDPKGNNELCLAVVAGDGDPQERYARCPCPSASGHRGSGAPCHVVPGTAAFKAAQEHFGRLL